MDASSAKHSPAKRHATSTRRKETISAGPAPGRPSVDAAARPCIRMSRTVACSSPGSLVLPLAAVPVTVKIPEPITMPTPRKARAHGPSVFRSRCDGSSDDLISSSIDLVWNSDTLALTLALHHLLHFALLRPAGDIGGSLGGSGSLLARGALQLLSFTFIGDFFCVHSILIP